MSWKKVANGKTAIAGYGSYRLHKLKSGWGVTGPGIPMMRRFQADGLDSAKEIAERILSPYERRFKAIQEQSRRYSGKGTRLYRIWEGIKSRTQNQNDKDYHHYGARGIRMCREWSASFKRFEGWAKTNGYSDELTIDRIDNNKGYSPDNCQWVSVKEQANNRRTNVLIEYNGEEKTLREWCDLLELNYQTMYSRIFRGKRWSVKKAFETP